MRPGRKARIGRTLLWTLAGALLAALPVSYAVTRGQARYSVLPYRTVVEIVRSSDHSSFLGEEEFLEQLPFALTDSVSSPIRTGALEQALVERTVYMKDVIVFVSPGARTLNIRAKERRPILRYYRGGKAYFLDDEGISAESRPGAAAEVPIAAGALTDSVLLQTVYPLALFLAGDEDYRSFFPFIDVVSGSKIHLYPRIGDYIFELHGVATVEEDLKKVPIFYRKIVPQVGADKYSLVKLSYKDQIICTRRDADE